MIRNENDNTLRKQKNKFPEDLIEHLYRRGFLGEVQNVNISVHDRFWGLGLSGKTIEPQYVPQKESVYTIWETPHAELTIDTRVT